MTTATKTGASPTSKMRTIELVCPCGRQLSVSAQTEKAGLTHIFMGSIRAVASASRWKICEDYLQVLGPTLDAYCPDCHKPEPLPCPSHAP